MIFCPNCGSRLENAPQFCPNCGVEIDRADLTQTTASSPRDAARTPADTLASPTNTSTPIPPKTSVSYSSLAVTPSSTSVAAPRSSAYSNKVSRRKSPVILILVILGGVFFFSGGSFVFSHPSTIEETREYSFTNLDFYSEYVFDFDVPSGKVNFGYNSSPQSAPVIITANFDLEIRSWDEKTFEDLFTIRYNEDPENAYFEVHRESWFMFYLYDSSEFEVILRTDFIYDLRIDTGSGDVNAIFPQSVDISNLVIDTGSGDISSLFLGNHVISESMDLETGSGFINVNASHLVLSSDLALSTGSGDIEVSFEAVLVEGIIMIETGSGYVDLRAQDSQFASEISLDTSSGSQTILLDHVQLGGDFYAELGSGSFVFTSSELSLSNDIIMEVDGGSGSKTITFTQSNPLTHLISGEFETGSGNVIFTINASPSVLPGHFTCDTGSGSVVYDISHGMSSSTEDSLTIGTFTGNTGLNLVLETGSGNIEIIN